ncbi:hypothetical protein B0H67DRAFT_585158 [Lasiosphaeris hirsuta]|uniref:Glutamate--tRNA ligase, mitochondrial n=1 Tax=Lasiosphaeris hirsuta TaxID=260670 RepID=A0AA40A8T7_9PEZI|nr:hypothetical protein B0H67DRAFT_585158 [Lasiosphaeris hirsuta]
MRGMLLPLRPTCLPCMRARLRVTLLFPRCQSFAASSLTSSRLGKGGTGRSSTKLPGTSCRTRFAPSPTGYMHLGSLRTALYNFIIAKATGGQFILRVEDTDQSRLVPDAEERVIRDLKWAGLDWDEGPGMGGEFGPYRQSERLPLYHEHADKLLRAGKAYRCFCTPEELDVYKKTRHDQSLPDHYPGTCSHISSGESEERASKGDAYAVRFKVDGQTVATQDIIYGRYSKKEPEEDFIIIKRDRFPTYHFANVIDDYFMKITHVIRGAEWLISTPKHVRLYDAFGWMPPQFAHLGLLVNAERQKLSKRFAGTTLSYYQEKNILPAALLNFVLLQGWGQNQSKPNILNLEEMIANASLKYSKGDIIVDVRKLWFFQDKHLRRALETPSPTLAVDPILKETLVVPIRNIIDSVERKKTSPSAALAIPAELDLLSIQKPVLENWLSVDEHVRDQHVLAVLRATKTPDTKGIGAWVANNRYLFWRVPANLYRHSLAEAAFPAEVSLAGTRGGPFDAMRYVLDWVKGVTEEAWMDETFVKLVPTIAQNISVVEGAEEDKYLGFRFIRWALFGSVQGPALGKVMLVLGRHETIERLEKAIRMMAADAEAMELERAD